MITPYMKLFTKLSQAVLFPVYAVQRNTAFRFTTFVFALIKNAFICAKTSIYDF